MSEKRLFTSESVTEGHPDKVSDQISDAVLDEIMSNDPAGKVACETLVTTGLVLVAGEITTEAYVDIPTIARGVVKNIGYTASTTTPVRCSRRSTNNRPTSVRELSTTKAPATRA